MRRCWSPGRPASSAATSSRSCSAAGYEVVGVDNFSKYGQVTKSYDDHPRLPARRGRRAATSTLMTELLAGLRPLHRRRRDDRRHLLLPRLRLRPARRRTSASSRPSLRRRDRGARQRRAAAEGHLHVAPRWCSSRPTAGPPREGDERKVPPPLSSYGFQKLAVEYFARAAWDQYRAAVHDRPPVQLRRHRREPGAGRRRDPVRQRQARDEPRRARPRAEGAQGPGPAAHPRRRRPGAALHLRRRPGPRHRRRAMEHPDALQRRLQPLDRRVDHACSSSPR